VEEKDRNLSSTTAGQRGHKTKAALFALLIVAVATLGRTLLVPQNASVEKGTAVRHKPETAIPTRPPKGNGFSVYDKQLLCALIQPYSAFPNSELSGCKKNASEILASMSEQEQQARFMLAIVPNPRTAAAALTFDRTLEAIEQAAEDADYDYRCAFFPWSSKTSDANNGPCITLPDNNDYPGVMLFHTAVNTSANANDKPYMVVFVVAEDATSGLNAMQFRTAVARMGAFNKRKDSQLNILGPTYSGSLDSLPGLLTADTIKTLGASTIRIFSGTVASNTNIVWFRRVLDQRMHNEPSVIYEFRTFQEDDENQINLFRRYLNQNGYSDNCLAVLTEDETAYGRLHLTDTHDIGSDPHDIDHRQLDSCSTVDNKYFLLYYPRDISDLRSAYQQESLFEPGGEKGSGRAALPSHLEESEDAYGGPALYGGKQIALSQEASLFQAVDVLRSRGIKYILIHSSNTLDQLFLVHFLRKSYAQAYVVTMGADLLYSRERDTNLLRGVMALSRYPLFVDNGQLLTEDHSSTTPLHIFASSGMAGSFQAFTALLSRTSVADNGPATGLWLSVMGRYGYWPLNCLNDPNHTACAPWNWKSDGSGESEPSHFPKVPPGWKLASYIFFGLVLLHLIFRFTGQLDPTLNILAPFVWEVGLRQAILMACGTAVVGYCVLVFWQLGFHSPQSSAERGYLMPALFMILFLIIGFWVLTELGFSLSTRFLDYRHALRLTLHKLVRNTQCYDDPLTNDLGARLYHRHTVATFAATVLNGLFIVLILFLTGYYWWNLRQASNGKTWLLFRYVRLASGVSPALPLLILIGGWYWWFLRALASMSLFGRARPRLPFYHPDDAETLAEKNTLERLHVPLLHRRLFDFSAITGNRIEDAAKPLASNLWIALSVILFLVLYLLRVSTRVYRVPGLLVVACLLLTMVLVFVIRFAEYRFFKELFLWLADRHGRVFGIKIALALVVLGIGVLGAHLAVAGSHNVMLVSLEGRPFDKLLEFMFLVSCGLLYLDTVQLLWSWLALRRLLVSMDRLPLREALAQVPGFSWRELWAGSNLLRRRRVMAAKQNFAAIRLKHCLLRRCNSSSLQKLPATGQEIISAIDALLRTARKLVTVDQLTSRGEPYWRVSTGRVRDAFNRLQITMAAATGVVFNALLEKSYNPSSSDSDSTAGVFDASFKRCAEEFVCLGYMNFIQNIIGRLRLLVTSIVGVFVLTVGAIIVYPWCPKSQLVLLMLIMFMGIAVVVALVYAGMHKDPVLSCITDTPPGRLGSDFWIRFAAFATVPILGLLAARFPEINELLLSSLERGFDSLR
jgi:hypothetical protein